MTTIAQNPSECCASSCCHCCLSCMRGVYVTFSGFTNRPEFEECSDCSTLNDTFYVPYDPNMGDPGSCEGAIVIPGVFNCIDDVILSGCKDLRISWRVFCSDVSDSIGIWVWAEKWNDPFGTCEDITFRKPPLFAPPIESDIPADCESLLNGNVPLAEYELNQLVDIICGPDDGDGVTCTVALDVWPQED